MPRKVMDRDRSIGASTLELSGVPRVDALTLAREGLPSGEIGHLWCQPKQDGELTLAFDADVPLVVRGGRVFALDGTDRLVNSTVLGFVRTVERYDRYVREVVGLDDSEGERVAIEAQADMRGIDHAAFADEDSYWPIVCEQMVEGNL